MPKLKTHSGTKKRLRLTKTGKVVRGSAGKNHLLQKKSAARKRRLNVNTNVTGKAVKNIKRKLGK
jgi:large subunit ribosomal protein L35